MKEVIDHLKEEFGENQSNIEKLEEDIQYHSTRLKDIQQLIRKTQQANIYIAEAIITLEKENG